MKHTKRPRHTRERLPARRRALTETIALKFRAPSDPPGSERGHVFDVTIGFYPDGRPGEVFVKAAQDLDGIMAFLLEDAAVLVSLLLQAGMTLPEIRAALSRAPEGEDAAAGDHAPAVSIIAALLDAIAGTRPMPAAVLTSQIVNSEIAHVSEPQRKGALGELLRGGRA